MDECYRISPSPWNPKSTLPGYNGLSLGCWHTEEAAVKHLGTLHEASMSRIHHVAQGLERVAQKIERWKNGWSWWNIWDCQFIFIQANWETLFRNWARGSQATTSDYSGSSSLIATKAANLPHLNYKYWIRFPMLTMLQAMGEKILLLQHIIGWWNIFQTRHPTTASMSGSKNSCRSKRV